MMAGAQVVGREDARGTAKHLPSVTEDIVRLRRVGVGDRGIEGCSGKARFLCTCWL